MGGKLNTILPGDAEPTEVGPMLCDMGIQGDNDIKNNGCADQQSQPIEKECVENVGFT